MAALNQLRWTRQLGISIAALCVIAQGCAEPEHAVESGPWVIGISPEGAQEIVADTDEEATDASSNCAPSCAQGQCGDDGCGGSCGPCSILTPFCYAGWCQVDPRHQPA